MGTTVATMGLYGSGASKKLIVRRRKKAEEKKNIHMILKGKDILRLEALRSRVDPKTQTEVIINALQLFDEILREYDSGSTFFIKREGDEEPVEYDVFG